MMRALGFLVAAAIVAITFFALNAGMRKTHGAEAAKPPAYMSPVTLSCFQKEKALGLLKAEKISHDAFLALRDKNKKEHSCGFFLLMSDRDPTVVDFLPDVDLGENERGSIMLLHLIASEAVLVVHGEQKGVLHGDNDFYFFLVYTADQYNDNRWMATI